MSEPAQPTTDAAEAQSVDALSARIKAIKASVVERAKALKKLQSTLDVLLARDVLQQPARIDALRAALAENPCHVDGLDELGAQLDDHSRRLRQQARQTLLQELSALAAAEQSSVDILGEQPLELQLGPLSAVLDLDAGRAELRYAREVVLVCPARASLIWETRRKALELIRSRAVESTSFFAHLLTAYRMVLLRSQRPAGEWVEIVDLLPALALAGLELKKWRGLAPGKLPELPRYQLAYALHRLRRDGALEHGGQRLELGTATGGSTRDKRNVLFVPHSPTEGQYYLTLRFVSTQS